MVGAACPAVPRDAIEGSGLHALIQPFAAPQGIGTGSVAAVEPPQKPGSKAVAPPCRWQMVFFLSEDCPSCKFQLDEIRAVQQQRFADVSHVSFVTVWPGTVPDGYAAQRAASAGSSDRSDTGVVGSRGVSPALDLAFSLGLRIVSDDAGRLSERFAVNAYPFVALIDHEGLVRGFWPGVLSLDAPGFERLSHILAGRAEGGLHSYAPLVCALLAVLCLLALSTFALRSVVRKRRAVLYDRQIS